MPKIMHKGQNFSGWSAKDIYNNYGMFIDTDRIIVPETTFLSSFTYTATEDCFIRIYVVEASNTSAFARIDGQVVWAIYSPSGYLDTSGTGFYLKKGQTIEVDGTNASESSRYSVFGLQPGSDPIKNAFGVFPDFSNVIKETTGFRTTDVTYQATEDCFVQATLICANGTGWVKNGDVVIMQNNNSGTGIATDIFPVRKGETLTFHTNYNSADSSYTVYGIQGGSGSSSGGGGGGTTDYEELDNLPSINEVTLIGDKTSEDLGIVISLTLEEYNALTPEEQNDPNKVYYIEDGGAGQNLLVPTPFIFSEDEQQIGIWIDGKPLYQKTVVISSFPSTAYTAGSYPHNISNVDKICDWEGVVRWASGNVAKIDHIDMGNSSTVSNTAWFGGFVGKTSIDIITGMDRSSCSGEFTIRYTKTTDIAWASGGFKAYGFTPVIYSDEEREIGVWRDGKPLYQKTIPVNISMPNQDTWYTTSVQFSEAETLVRIWHRTVLLQGGIESTNKYIVLLRTTNRGDTLIDRVTVQYTKTTDTAGSGKYTTLGTQTVHYSTGEQIIGTWIDGKTLYQKTFTPTTASTTTATVLADVGSGNEIKYFYGLIDNSRDLNSYYESTQYSRTWITNNKYQIGSLVSGSTFISKPCTITVQYTRSS